MALYEQAVIYAADDTTIFATISSDPAGVHPHLGGMDGQGEAQVNFIQGTATIGQLVFRVLDVPTARGDQQSGYFTSLLADAGGNMQLKGRRVVYGRQQTTGGAYVTQFDGLIEEIAKQTGIEMVFYRIACRDVRERARQTRIFVQAIGTTIMPRGIINGYGTAPSGKKLVGAVTPLHGTFWRDPNAGVSAQSGRVKLDVRWPDLHMGVDWAKDLIRLGTPQVVATVAGRLTISQFTKIRVYWRAEGSGGAYNVLQNMPVVGGTQYNTTNAFPQLTDGLDVIALMEKGNWSGLFNINVNMLVLMNATGVAIPTHLQRIEMYVETMDEPNDADPLYIEGRAGQIYKDLLDGVYSSYDPSVNYDSTAMTAMIANTPVVRVPIRAPENDMLAWSEKNLLKPFGYAPAVVNGAIAPVKYSLPDVTVPLLQLNDAIVRSDAAWAYTKDGVLNTISFKYPIESLRKPTFGLEAERDRINESPGEVMWQNTTSAALLGTQDVTYDQVTVRSFAVGTGGNVLSGDQQDDFGGRIAGQRIADVRDRFLFGDQRISAPSLRSDAGVAAAKVGDWAQVGISWLPELSTGRLGANRLMQIVKIQETDAIWRTLELSDAGPGVVVTGLPTLGALSLTGLMVNAPITGVPANGEARVDYAVGSSQPLPDSGDWQQAGRLGANGTVTFGPFVGGQTVWARVRGEQVGKRRSAWSAGSSIVITNNPTITGPLTLTFDATNHPVVTAPVNGITLGVRFSYALIAIGTEFTGTYTNTMDVAPSAGVASATLPITVPGGYEVVVAATPYTGFTAGAVSGTPGVQSEHLIAASVASFGGAEPILPIAEELTTTTGMTGTLTLQVTDPQLRLTLVEFSHQSGDGAWSSWATDSIAPYADSVTLLESKTSKIAYRLTAYDENGVLRVIRTNEVSFSLGAAPTIPQLSLSVSPTGHLIATFIGDERTASFKTNDVTGADPSLATIRAGALVNGRTGTFDFGAMTVGVDYHVGVLAYSATAAGGVESQAAYARITNPDVVAANPQPPVALIYQSTVTAPTVSTDRLTLSGALGSGAAGPLTWRYRTYMQHQAAPAWGAFQPNSGGTALPYELAVTRALKWITVVEMQLTDGVRTSSEWYYVASKMDALTDNGVIDDTVNMSGGARPFKRGIDTSVDVISTSSRGFIDQAGLDVSLRPTSVYRGSAYEAVTNLFKRGVNTLTDVVDDGTYRKTGATYVDASNRPHTLYRATAGDNIPGETLASNLGSDVENMVLNGGGQEGVLGSQAPSWTYIQGANLVPTTSGARIGDRSLSIVSGGSDSISYQDFNVVDQAVYELSGWLSCLTPVGSGQGTILAISIQSGATGFLIIEKVGYDPDSTHPDVGLARTGGTQDWTFVRSVFKMIGSGVIRLFAYQGYNGTIQGTSWYDGVKLRRVHRATNEGGFRGFNALTSKNRLVDQRNSIAVNTSNRNSVQQSDPLTAADVGTSATISIASHFLQFGFGTVSYNSGSITGLAFSTTYYVYADDPDYLGGAVTYVATQDMWTAIANTGRYLVGKITTPADGTGGTGGTGGGGCVEEKSWLSTNLQACNAKPGDVLDLWIGGPRSCQHQIDRVVESRERECVEIVSQSGARLVVSTDTPVTLRSGREIKAVQLMLDELPILLENGLIIWEPVDVRPVGIKRVRPIYAGGGTFAASDRPTGARIFTHNMSKAV